MRQPPRNKPNSRLPSKLDTDILSNGEDNTAGWNGVLFTFSNINGSNYRSYVFTNNGIYFIMIDATGNVNWNGFSKIFGLDITHDSSAYKMKLKLGTSCRFKALKISGGASYQMVSY